MSVVYKRDSVAGFLHFLEHMAAHENGFAFFVLGFDYVEEGYSHKRIQSGGRLVENYYRRIVHKRGDERGFLLHALAHTL